MDLITSLFFTVAVRTGESTVVMVLRFLPILPFLECRLDLVTHFCENMADMTALISETRTSMVDMVASSLLSFGSFPLEEASCHVIRVLAQHYQESLM